MKVFCKKKHNYGWSNFYLLHGVHQFVYNDMIAFFIIYIIWTDAKLSSTLDTCVTKLLLIEPYLTYISSRVRNDICSIVNFKI